MKLIALGDNSIDLYRNTGEAFPGGNAVNVAVHAAAAGAQAAYLGYFGEDEMAAILQSALREKKVNIDRSQVIKGGTTKACVYDVINGERKFLDVITGDLWAGAIQLEEDDYQYLAKADIVVSSCNAKLPEQIGKAAALPAIFAFDFGEKEKYRTDDYYDQVCVSGMDLAMFSCEPMTTESFRLLCEPLHRRGVRHVLATMGAKGQMMSNGEKIIICEPKQVDARDTMGAGDAFLAGFLTELFRRGWKKNAVMEEDALLCAMQFGAQHAAENCMKDGGIGIRAELSPEEINDWKVKCGYLDI